MMACIQVYFFHALRVQEVGEKVDSRVTWNPDIYVHHQI
jgi:hypothetical protein